MKSNFSLAVWLLFTALLMVHFSCLAIQPLTTKTAVNPLDRERIVMISPFPIMAWIGLPPESPIGAYQTMKDAGFSYDLMTFFQNADQVEKALDKANSLGLKGIINLPELNTHPEKTIRRFKNHPALLGYTVFDEPRIGDLDSVEEKMKRIQSFDKEHITYINLLASGVPEGYLGLPFPQYLDQVTSRLPLQILSFSYYPIALFDGKNELELDKNWYESLELFSQKAEELEIPLWTLNLAASHYHIDRFFPVPTLEHLRLQVYSNLAYGSQTLQYYTYTTPKDAPQYRAAIKADGTTSDIYELLKEVNSEVLSLSGVFVGAKKLDVWHTGDNLPLGTKPLDIPSPFEYLKTEGEGAVVSLLENKGRRYLMVVNRSFKEEMILTVKGTDNVYEVDKEAYLSKESLAEEKIYRISPGDIRLFSWSI